MNSQDQVLAIVTRTGDLWQQKTWISAARLFAKDGLHSLEFRNVQELEPGQDREPAWGGDMVYNPQRNEILFASNTREKISLLADGIPKSSLWRIDPHLMVSSVQIAPDGNKSNQVGKRPRVSVHLDGGNVDVCTASDGPQITRKTHEGKWLDSVKLYTSGRLSAQAPKDGHLVRCPAEFKYVHYIGSYHPGNWRLFTMSADNYRSLATDKSLIWSSFDLTAVMKDSPRSAMVETLVVPMSWPGYKLYMFSWYGSFTNENGGTARLFYASVSLDRNGYKINGASDSGVLDTPGTYTEPPRPFYWNGNVGLLFMVSGTLTLWTAKVGDEAKLQGWTKIPIIGMHEEFGKGTVLECCTLADLEFLY